MLLYVHSCQQKSIGLKFCPKPEVTCGTVAIIIRVVLLSPYLRVPFLCPPFITINHTAYILTEDDNTFA